MKLRYLFAAGAALVAAGSANAATVVSAAVFGSTNSTVWTTAGAPGTNSGNYTLFVASPGVGSYLNANDEAIAYQTKSGENYAYLSGDGYFPGQNTNSDPLYRLQLTFDNGAVLRGTYAPGSANAFVAGTSVTVGNQTFTLTDFSFQRDRADTVSQYTAVRGGDSNDYFGNFVFNQSATAVPEPATWAMMMLGFGMVGFALRSRRNGKVTTRVAFA